MITKTAINATLLSLSLGLSANATAADTIVDIEIANLSNAIYFTPLLVAAHPRDLHLYQVGHPASAGLQAMAEGGDTSGLIDQVSDAGGDFVADPVPGMLAPGNTTTTTLQVARGNGFLSIVAMLLPTNDGFVGLEGLRIPRRPGTYTYYLEGYDAGTEANDEQITGGGAPGEPGIPGDPSGLGGTGGTGVAGDDHNPNVHVHRGTVGDFRPTGGPSDLDAGAHHWLNPVAKVTLTVQ